MSTEIEQLKVGYREFRRRYFNRDNSTFKILAEDGQSPKFLVIACCDSRVDPAIIMNCQPGDLFVVRNVANLVPPYEDDGGYHGTSAALEFAVRSLEVRHIIIFGHSKCGGVAALLHQSPAGAMKSFVAKWMGLAEGAKKFTLSHYPEASAEQQIEICSQQGLMNSLKNLHTFPWITSKVKLGELFLHAWYFDLSKGLIHAFDSKKNAFFELS